MIINNEVMIAFQIMLTIWIPLGTVIFWDTLNCEVKYENTEKLICCGPFVWLIALIKIIINYILNK